MNCEPERIAKENAYAEYMAAYSVWLACVAAQQPNCEALKAVSDQKKAEYEAAWATWMACLAGGTGTGGT